MTYQKALAVLTDWFHEYHDDKSALVRERHITEEYNEAVDVVSKALCKLIEYENKIAKGEYIAPFKYEKKQYIQFIHRDDGGFSLVKGATEGKEYNVSCLCYMDKNNQFHIEDFLSSIERDEIFEAIKENKND